MNLILEKENSKKTKENDVIIIIKLSLLVRLCCMALLLWIVEYIPYIQLHF